MRASRNEVQQLHENLKGGLPFPDEHGRQRKPKALDVRASALTPAQSESEKQHAFKMMNWLRMWGREFPELARTFHVANEFVGDDRTPYTKADGTTGWASNAANRRKLEGVKPGVFDYYNLASRRGFSGLGVELKVRANKLTSDPDAEWDQSREREFLLKEGKAVHVCWSWAEAAAVHVWYFQLYRIKLVNSFMYIPLATWLTKQGGHDKRCGCDLNLEEFFRGVIGRVSASGK